MRAIPYKSNRNVYYSCKYHGVWCPKYRRKVLVSGIDERLKQIITEGCKEHQAEIMSMEIMPDHVHLLLECDPPLGDSAAGSSPQRTLIPAFTPGVSSIGAQITDVVDQLVFVSTVGGAPLTVIKQYIENQKHV